MLNAGLGQRPAFMPPDLANGLRRNAARIIGLGLVAAGLMMFLSLIAYHPDDVSYNNAHGGPTHNLLGPLGAHIADGVLQSIGLAGVLVAAVMICWGTRLIRGRPFGWMWLRLTLMPVGLIAVATGLALFTPTPSWPLASGYGGFSGDLMLLHGLRFAGETGFAAPPWALAVLAFGIGFCLMLHGLAVSMAEWHRLGHGMLRGAARLAGGNRPAADIPHSPAAAGRAARLKAKKAAKAAKRAGAAQGLMREPVGPQSDEDSSAPEIKAPPVDIVVAKESPTPGKRETEERQSNLDLGEQEYLFPPLTLLEAPGDTRNKAVDEEALAQNARLLESVLGDFGVKGRIVQVRPGPVVTLYELEPAPGVKSSRVIGLADDIARSMSAISVRVAVVPGRNVIGIELPNQDRETVHLREMLSSSEFERASARLPMCLGKDIGGAPVIADLAKMPHLMIAGTTGSGKSVGVNAMILSLLYRLSPDECKFIMVDPKMLELSVYDGIPHLLTPVVTDPHKAVMALKWAVREMEDRYRAMSQLSVRNIAGYNKRITEAKDRGETLSRKVQTGFDPETGKPQFEEQDLPMDPLPYIVIIVDEMADLMLVAGKDVEALIQRLAQMARAAGLHLVMATQRPSVDVITGTIKANFPTRISYSVTSKIDSRTILGEMGAEQLLGMGDMLYMGQGGRIKRVHGPFCSDEEVESVVRHLQDQGQPTYLTTVTEEPEESAEQTPAEGGGSGESLYDQAVNIVLRERKASTSFIQRKLSIGYNRAAQIIERMESDGVVSGANHVGKREVLVQNSDGTAVGAEY